jgi:hypothetical protein
MKEVDHLCERYELACASGGSLSFVCGHMPSRWMAVSPDNDTLPEGEDAMPTTETTRAYEKLKVIDTDSHLTEPHDLWIKRREALRAP